MGINMDFFVSGDWIQKYFLIKKKSKDDPVLPQENEFYNVPLWLCGKISRL